MTLRTIKRPVTVADEVNNRLAELRAFIGQCERDLKRGDRIDLIDGLNIVASHAKQVVKVLRSTIPGRQS